MAGSRVMLAYRMHTNAPLALGRGDLDGQPVLAGSTLKGAVRRLAVRLATSLGSPICRADGDASCAVCRLFGAPGLEAALRWTDAPLAHGGIEAALSGVRLRQPVLRDRRVAAPGLVPARRIAAAGLAFAGRAEGWLGEQPGSEARGDLALAVAALRLLTHVGGGRSLGCGRVTVEVTTIELDGQRFAASELVDTLLAGGPK